MIMIRAGIFIILPLGGGGVVFITFFNSFISFFSTYMLLDENRQSFVFENLKMVFVTHCNSKFKGF